MTAIHGKSHQAIRYFHQQAAALEVYWIYVSRANYENVAWPSARGLGRDTKFDKTVCLNARHWLVEHGALEQVKKYVRPEWRELPENEQRKRLNLDKSEYYRPTGRLIVGDEIFFLLYFGGQESSDIEIVPSEDDVRSGRTPTPADADGDGRRPGRTELDSSLEPDSRKAELFTSSELNPAAAAAADNVFTLFEKAFGAKALAEVTASELKRDELKDMQDLYALDWIATAFRETALAGATMPIKYALAILKRMADEQARREAIAAATEDLAQQGPIADLETPAKPVAPEGMEREFEGWQSALFQLKFQVDRNTFDTWIWDTQFVRSDAGDSSNQHMTRFFIRCKNAFAQEQLQHRLYRTIRRVLETCYGSPVEVLFVTAEKETDHEPV